MSIPTSFFDQIRDRVTLSTAIQNSSVALKKAGREWKACCPFHSEKSPSFTVNDEKGFYHCFGCGAHGDVIRWMVDHNGLPFMEAVKELAVMAGLEMPAKDPRAAERERQREGAAGLMKLAAERFETTLSLNSDGPAAQYLKGRNITLAEIQKFQIGFAPKVGMTAKPFVAALSDKPEPLIAVGLLGQNKDTGRVYDFFRDRIMIPIHDQRGRVIGFGGRIVGEGTPKYINSPDTPYFDKGRTLFNIHRAAPAGRAKNRLVMVEGYFDVIGLASVGIDEAVAPNGTAITEHQLMMAWKIVDQPIIWMDGDKAGQKAALRAIERALPLLTAGKGLQFVLPEGNADPDDIAREQGAEAISSMLANTFGIADVIWRAMLDRLKADPSPEMLASVRRDIWNMLRTIKDKDVRDTYAAEFKNRFSSYENRRSALPNRHKRRDVQERRSPRQAAQDAIAQGFLRHVEFIGDFAEDLARVQWIQPAHARLVEALIWYDGETPLTPSNLAEIAERRGLGEEYRYALSLQTLRFPYVSGPVNGQSAQALRAAIISSLK